MTNLTSSTDFTKVYMTKLSKPYRNKGILMMQVTVRLTCRDVPGHFNPSKGTVRAEGKRADTQTHEPDSRRAYLQNMVKSKKEKKNIGNKSETHCKKSVDFTVKYLASGSQFTCRYSYGRLLAEQF